MGAESQETPFRIGCVPGVVVSKWTRTWSERFPDRALEVIRIEHTDQEDALRAGRLDMCFVRAPLDREGLSAIPLYTEVAVVVLPAEHPLADADEVSVRDLVDEDLLQDPQTVPQLGHAVDLFRLGDRAPAPDIRSTADAVALVAAGLGVLILPMSVARLYRRRDVTSRPVSDAVRTDVLLAWPSERTTDEIEDFIGVVRGRTPRSSRGRTATGAEHSSADARPAANRSGAARGGGKSATAKPRRRRR